MSPLESYILWAAGLNLQSHWALLSQSLWHTVTKATQQDLGGMRPLPVPILNCWVMEKGAPWVHRGSVWLWRWISPPSAILAMQDCSPCTKQAHRPLKHPLPPPPPHYGSTHPVVWGSPQWSHPIRTHPTAWGSHMDGIPQAAALQGSLV